MGDECLATSISPACVNQAVPARCSVDICSGIGNVVDGFALFVVVTVIVTVMSVMTVNYIPYLITYLIKIHTLSVE